MKPNEALAIIAYGKEMESFDVNVCKETQKQAFEVVENAIKDLERAYKKLNKLKEDYVELEHDRDTYRTAYRNELESRNTNPNIKEALRVILTKRINVKRFIEAKTYKDYNENLRESEQLTKSEFFNLKETIFVCVLS